ncbi:MAG: histidinol-phosphate transaminase [Dictyoglomus sp. NZ13-RE01]|nr:MAG: histidinol-phosphate transaminase [Dictyoglomus sp. NZ13-RE01]
MWEEIIKKDYTGYKVEVKDLPISLARNENPYDLPLEIKQEVINKLLNTPWNRYPDSKAYELKNALADFLKIPYENILLGNGSGEIINIISNALLSEGDEVILPQPTFPLYKKIFQQKDVIIHDLFLNKEDFSMPWEKLDSYKKRSIKLIVICNPNNPTGNLLIEPSDLDKILDFNSIILIDEAYYEFSKVSFIDLINDYPNIMILRTFSKAFSCAGVRLGYLVAHRNLINYLENFRLPYNLNIFSQITGTIVLKYWDILEKRIEEILRYKEEVYSTMRKFENIKVFPSTTNFLLFRTEKKELLDRKLVDWGIALRDFSKEPLLENCLRVTIGSREENEKFLNCLSEVLS